MNYVAISNRARPSVAPPPVPTSATSAPPRSPRPAASAPPNATQGLKMVSLGRGGAVGGVASRTSLPTSMPPAIGSRGISGASGGSNGGLETVKAKFDYVAQVGGDSVYMHYLWGFMIVVGTGCKRDSRGSDESVAWLFVTVS